MKKFVVYNVVDCSIVCLQDERPELTLLPTSQDFDTTENWMSFDSFKNKIERFLKVN